ncbi:sensor kinase of copper sensing two-component system [Pedobacter sp. BAL39]|nr:sensor kinase of copper sensing two-component system [Pedobacter sp. BAL39]
MVVWLSFGLVCQAGAQEVSFGNSTDAARIAAAKEQYNKGNYPESLEGALPVYLSALQRKDQKLVADAGNVIGLIYLAQQQPKVAIQYFRSAAAVNLALNNQERLAANYLNIGLTHSDLNQLDSGVYYLKKSLVISKREKIKNLVAMGNNQLGETYVKQKHFQLAEQLFQSVLKAEDFQSDWENSFANAGLARSRFSQGRYAEAGKFADQAFKLASKSEANWDAVQALELAHKAYKAIGDHQTAYNRLLAYKTYYDEVYGHDKDKLVSKLLLKEKSAENEVLKKEVQITLQNRKIDRLILIVVLIGALLVILIAVFIARRYMTLNRNNRALKRMNVKAMRQNKLVVQQNDGLNQMIRHKDHLFSILSHDLRSPFALIESTLDLFGSGNLTQQELQILASELADQTHAASMMLDSLLVWAGNQLEGITTRRVPIDLVEKVDKIIMVASAVADRKMISLEHERLTLPAVQGDADQVRIMLQNLLSNAIKYTAPNGTIRISYAMFESSVEFVIQDNGIGMDSKSFNALLDGSNGRLSTYGTLNEKGIGLGFRLVRDFAGQNQITITGSSEIGVGTTFRLRFDIA